MRRLLLTCIAAGLLCPALAAAQCDVTLVSAGSSKLNVVKAVKAITGLGLKESKELVDDTPSTIATGLSDEDALSMAATLEDAGAEVSVTCAETDAADGEASPCAATVTVTGEIDGDVLTQVSLLLSEAGCSVEVTAPDAAETAACGSYRVVLDSYGANKLNVVKAVKAITGLGLKDAKDLVDAAPSTLLEGASLEEAQDAESSIEDAGGQASVGCD